MCVCACACACVCVCVCERERERDILEYYSVTEDNEILPFTTTWMDLVGIMPSNISQRKTSTILFHLCMEYKKIKMKKKWPNITKQKQIYRFREQTGGCQSGGKWVEQRSGWGRLRGCLERMVLHLKFKKTSGKCLKSYSLFSRLHSNWWNFIHYFLSKARGTSIFKILYHFKKNS